MSAAIFLTERNKNEIGIMDKRGFTEMINNNISDNSMEE